MSDYYNRLQILLNMADTFDYAAKAARGEGRASCEIAGPVECFERDAKTLRELVAAFRTLVVSRSSP